MTIRLLATATCPECDREFNLLDEDDAQEWHYGHDCEVERSVDPADCEHPRMATCPTGGEIIQNGICPDCEIRLLCYWCECEEGS